MIALDRWGSAILTTVVVGLAISAGCFQGHASGRLNVVFITLDTTRADRLGCYGYHRPTSPHLDSLARDGVRFETAIAQASVTPVSHASIFTGLDPQRHGLRVIYGDRGYQLPPQIPTMAEILRDEGWSTSAFLSSFTVSDYFGLNRGFEHVANGLVGDADGTFERQGDGSYTWQLGSNQRRADRTTTEALKWIREQDEAFFVWVHYWDPHDKAVIPPREFLREFAREAGGGPLGRTGLYDAEVRYVDQQIGRLVAALRERGDYDDTLIVVVGDHGEGLDDHGWWSHRILYQEQIRIPLIMRIPGGPIGRTVPELVRSTDVLPTVLDLVEIDAPSNLDGRSLGGLIQGRPEPPRYAYAEALNRFDLNAGGQFPDEYALLHTMMDRRWKLIYRPLDPDRSELYDLLTDPRETRNLFHAERDRARELIDRLQRTGGLEYDDFGSGSDPEAVERLRSLGYLGGA